jgi:hypothetical protein
MTKVDAEWNVFVDESIHVRGDFIVVAAVFAEDGVAERVTAALIDCGFDPASNEFKSSMTMRDAPAAQKLRSHVQVILRSCKIAVAVCPVSERNAIATHVANLLSAVDLSPNQRIARVFVDEGIKLTSAAMPGGAIVRFGCDSRVIRGIQLADCAAHLISTTLLGELGLTSKMVAASTVYDGQEGEIELVWTLWAAVRYALSGGIPLGEVDEDGIFEPLMKPFGLLVSDFCSDAVQAAVVDRLGSVWVGCIH